jgi:hypothetical protein
MNATHKTSDTGELVVIEYTYDLARNNTGDSQIEDTYNVYGVIRKEAFG